MRGKEGEKINRLIPRTKSTLGRRGRTEDVRMEMCNSFPSRMKKLSYQEGRDALDFFRRYDVPEDPNFSPEKNRAVIEGTIKKNEALMKKRKKVFRNVLQERIEAVAYYLRSQHGAQSSTPIMRYLGKRWQAKTRGELIMKQLQDTLEVRNQFGKVIRKPKEVKFW